MTYADYYKYSLNKLENIGKDNYLLKVKDIGDNNLKDFIKAKHKLTDDFDVVVPKVGSQLSNEVENSIELKELLKNNYIDIKNNIYKNSSVGLNFNKSTGLRLTIGKSELYNPSIDKNGNFSGLIVDYYDFDFQKPNGIFTYINNNAYRQQVNNKLKNYAIIVPINIEKKKLENMFL